MRRLFPLVVVAVIGLASIGSVLAWNDAGHLTIARIAWERLNDSQREKVVAILRKHPHRDELLLKNRPADATDAEWMFIRAAVWCDHIRPPRSLARDQIATHPIHKFHRGPWHYVNYPYKAGQTESALPEKPLVGEGPHPTNIVEQLDLTMKLLKGEAAADPGRDAHVTDDENNAVRTFAPTVSTTPAASTPATEAFGLVSPPSSAGITAATETAGCASRQSSTSRGATNTPPTLNRSSTRP